MHPNLWCALQMVQTTTTVWPFTTRPTDQDQWWCLHRWKLARQLESVWVSRNLSWTSALFPSVRPALLLAFMFYIVSITSPNLTSFILKLKESEQQLNVKWFSRLISCSIISVRSFFFFFFKISCPFCSLSSSATALHSYTHASIKPSV